MYNVCIYHLHVRLVKVLLPILKQCNTAGLGKPSCNQSCAALRWCDMIIVALTGAIFVMMQDDAGKIGNANHLEVDDGASVSPNHMI